ncbi:MAG: hypothetical protein K2X69_13830 [Silvanigrellaceae bacterium]|nr:hypothetical protein [Silvanigrellaceae bacterium]
MGNKSLSFKIITSISILVALILFSCVYCITMINKTQVYAQDTATNWLPNIEMMGKIANIFGSLSRRHVLVMANNLANQLEEAEKNKADLAKFRETLEKYLKDYVTNGMIAPGEQAYYDVSLKSYNEY